MERKVFATFRIAVAAATVGGIGVVVASRGENATPESIKADPRYATGRDLNVALNLIDGTKESIGVDERVNSALQELRTSKSSVDSINPTQDEGSPFLKELSTNLGKSEAAVTSAKDQTNQVIQSIKDNLDYQFYRANVHNGLNLKVYFGFMTAAIGAAASFAACFYKIEDKKQTGVVKTA